MKRVVLLMAAALALGGCESAIREQADAARAAGEAACRQEIMGPSVALATCLNNTYRTHAQAVGYPYRDLVELSFAKRIEIHGKLASGEWTKDQADMYWAQAMAEIGAEEHRRSVMDAQAAAAIFGAMKFTPVYQVAPTPMQVSPPIHCATTQLGSTINTRCQ